VVQLVGHLTVNEDGVGSSPTAPANLSQYFFALRFVPSPVFNDLRLVFRKAGWSAGIARAINEAIIHRAWPLTKPARRIVPCDSVNCG
jgi:hypothetical protein